MDKDNLSFWKWMLFVGGILLTGFFSIFELNSDNGFANVSLYGLIVLGIGFIMFVESIFILLCLDEKDTAKNERSGFLLLKGFSIVGGVFASIATLGIIETVQEYWKVCSIVLLISLVVVLFFGANWLLYKKILNERKGK